MNYTNKQLHYILTLNLESRFLFVVINDELLDGKLVTNDEVNPITLSEAKICIMNEAEMCIMV